MMYRFSSGLEHNEYNNYHIYIFINNLKAWTNMDKVINLASSTNFITIILEF